MLSTEELYRYARHISLEKVGIEGQQKLKAARVVLVGAGGLGSPVLHYLTAAGVGTIGIIDFDVVDESNLQRQVLYTTNDIGKPKVKVAIDRMMQLNPHVNFVPHQTQLNTENALEIFSNYDVVIDGTDNFATRYLVNDACVVLNKPFVHGSIFKFQGQVAVFNYQNGPSYRCLYPNPPELSEAPNCSEVGVLGILPGVIGTRMASECLKIILDLGEVLSGKLEVIDLLKNQTTTMSILRNPANFARTALEDSYESRCLENSHLDETITPHELKQYLDTTPNLILVDVREDFELEICSFENAVHIPLGTLPIRFTEIPKQQPVVVICHHGVRSANAIAFLKDQGYQNLSNLAGGIHAWALEIDPTFATY